MPRSDRLPNIVKNLMDTKRKPPKPKVPSRKATMGSEYSERNLFAFLSLPIFDTPLY
nr:hypothetical protein [uncultured archaeon]